MSDQLEVPPPPPCPICGGTMEGVYQRYGQTVAVCVDCHSGITIPHAALDVRRLKRENKFKPRRP